MDVSSFLMPRKSIPRTEVQTVAGEIAASYAELPKIGLYLRVVKRIGPAAARRIAAEIIQESARNRAALFLFKARQLWTKK